MAPRESKSQPQQSKTVLVSELKELLIRACCRYQWMMVDDFWQYLAAVTDSPLTRNHVGKVVSSLAGGSDETPGQYLFKFALPKTTSGAAQGYLCQALQAVSCFAGREKRTGLFGTTQTP